MERSALLLLFSVHIFQSETHIFYGFNIYLVYMSELITIAILMIANQKICNDNNNQLLLLKMLLK